jgi:hypothetical protein
MKPMVYRNVPLLRFTRGGGWGGFSDLLIEHLPGNFMVVYFNQEAIDTRKSSISTTRNV